MVDHSLSYLSSNLKQNSRTMRSSWCCFLFQEAGAYFHALLHKFSIDSQKIEGLKQRKYISGLQNVRRVLRQFA